MAVYVDNAYLPFGRMTMCHLAADTREELFETVDAINLSRKWIQKKGTWKEHFDLSKGKRQLAVQLGAIEITTEDLVRKMRKRWESRSAAAAGAER